MKGGIKTRVRRNTLHLFAALASICALTLSTGCEDELRPGEPSDDFICCSDEDCLSGFICVDAVVAHGVCEYLGSCQSIGDGHPDDRCHDRDRDGYLSGEECPDREERQDCDDPDRGGALIYPHQEERCDGIDNNCNGEVDEDVEPRLCTLQYGVCNGSLQYCQSDVAGPDCEDSSTCWTECEYHPAFFEQPEVSCDGIDNNCDNRVDEHCDCIPDEYPSPQECGFEIGACGRGIRYCLADGLFSPCVLADMGSSCASDADCGTGVCVEERLDWREDFEDGCRLGSEPSCARTVCRHMTGTAVCTSDEGCSGREACVADFCQLLAVQAGDSGEECNGVDDDCNGRIDDGGICAPCPHNMVYHDAVPGYPTGRCVARYLASRPDATADDPGVTELYAAVRVDVLPWTGITDVSQVDDACRATEINAHMPGAISTTQVCTSSDLVAVCPECLHLVTACIEVEPTNTENCTEDGVCWQEGVTEIGHQEAGEVDPACVGFRCCAVPTN